MVSLAAKYLCEWTFRAPKSLSTISTLMEADVIIMENC